MEASSYICPNCGSVMEFDSEKQKMVCVHCEHEMSVDELHDRHEEIKEEFGQENESGTKESIYGEFEQNERSGNFKFYRCQGCGAEILTDENTAATFCTFCGRPSMMEDRLTGELLPSYVIPFKLKRDTAVKIYTEWAKKGVLTPSKLKSQSTIDKITGMYVPFWLYDYKADMQMNAHCTRVRIEVHGDYKYIHTDHFAVDRDVETEYLKVPADASEKMPDDIMDKLEPFMYNQLDEFEMPYLSGYYAEKYNYDSVQMAPRVEKRVREYIYNLTRSTIKGYTSVDIRNQHTRLGREQAKYALLPVWILNYVYEGKNHMFALNGQTGKIVADRPVSKCKAAVWFASITGIAFIILLLIGRFLG